jgi:hypothetical protein
MKMLPNLRASAIRALAAGNAVALNIKVKGTLSSERPILASGVEVQP